jgi:hypothetical protein
MCLILLLGGSGFETPLKKLPGTNTLAYFELPNLSSLPYFRARPYLTRVTQKIYVFLHSQILPWLNNKFTDLLR